MLWIHDAYVGQNKFLSRKKNTFSILESVEGAFFLLDAF